MAEKSKVLAREYFESLEIKDPEQTETWVQIGGLSSLSVSYDSNQTEVTDFDSEGFSENLTTERSFSIEAEGFRLVDPETGDVDPGQKIVDDYAETVGYASIADVRVNLIGGSTLEMRCSIEPGNQGGGVNDAASWGATFNSFGKPSIS